MKKNRILNKFLLALALPLLALGCSEDESSSATADFASIASSYYEADGTGTVLIPLRNAKSGTAENIDLIFGGTATEGEDYELVGVTSEGVEISIIDDSDYESNETIRVQANLEGNNIHTISIVSDCLDTDGIPASFFAGSWAALEDYGGGGTFGPYNVTLVQDATNPAKFTFSNFYGSGASYVAYVIYDQTAGTVSFPNQSVGAPGAITASSGTFVIDLCEETTIMTINLTYDGGPWVYRFTKN